MNLLRVSEREAGKNKTLGPELQSCGRWLADLTLLDLAPGVGVGEVGAEHSRHSDILKGSVLVFLNQVSPTWVRGLEVYSASCQAHLQGFLLMSQDLLSESRAKG